MADYAQAMLELAHECETRSNPEDVYSRFVSAYDLMWEARGGEPEEAHLGKMSFRETFIRLLRVDAYESAAIMLMPVAGRTGPGHYGGSAGSYYPFSFGIGATDPEGVQRPYCRIDNPHNAEQSVDSTAPLPGLAMIAAILKGDAAWQPWTAGGA